MVYEFRKYEAAAGRLPEVLNRFERTTVGLFERHGFSPVGFWQTDVGTSNELHYLLRWKDSDERVQHWAAFAADPEWREAKARTEANGAIVARIHNQLWIPTSFSPLR
jgi:heme-degrading monooxygenase HmoA